MTDQRPSPAPERHPAPPDACGHAGSGNDAPDAPTPAAHGANAPLIGGLRPEVADLFRPERLEAQEEAFWHGRRIAELSDAELAAAMAGVSEEPPPDPPPVRSTGNWRKLSVTWPEPRVSVTLRLDESVITWFRRAGRGYQARMNAVLRAYVDAQRAEEQKRRR